MFYNPTLGMIALALIGMSLFAREWRVSSIRTLHLALGLTIAYGLMFADNTFGLWSSFGFDFSTHTAVAVALVTYLCVHAPKAALVWIISLVGYFIFMVYKGYHGVLDVITTTVAVLLPLVLLVRYLNSFKPLNIPTYKIFGSAGAN